MNIYTTNKIDYVDSSTNSYLIKTEKEVPADLVLIPIYRDYTRERRGRVASLAVL